MNTGQMLMSVGAVILIGLIVLRNSNVNMHSTEMVTQSKIRILMTDFAQSIIEDISSRRFSETTVNGSVDDLTDLEAANTLKIDGTPENKYDVTTFDDFDDFNRDSTNGYTYDETYNGIPLRVKVRVYYVVPTNSSLPVSSSAQWYKKADITVNVVPGNYTYMKDESIKISRIFSYFQFP